MNKKEYNIPGAGETSGLSHTQPEEIRTVDVVQDPVCGMPVDPEKSESRLSYQDKLFFFCSAACALKFKTHPEQYIRASAPQNNPYPHHTHTDTPDVDDDRDVVWTCPMHPEIMRYAPGSCPLCGMALVVVK
ncbi:YHS domain-containing protein [Serratia microhaemolytica]|uniref:YHS domain-containing protein n=1 Tax=Serratia microhaemolytica TaxID=2675110 RepID=UPI0013923ED1|nr:YHS domain-containing protein [Serratia microhaemolytica]